MENVQCVENIIVNDVEMKESKVLGCKDKAPCPQEGFQNPARVLYCAQNEGGIKRKENGIRYIPQTAEKVFDLPSLMDDYYLNLMDWSSENVLAVGLGNGVYLWNATSGDLQKLMQLKTVDNYVSSLTWLNDGKYLSVGTSGAEIQLWDVTKMKQLRSMKGHSQRIGALASYGAILTSGCQDGNIFHHDVRQQKHHLSTLVGHTQEVCNLKWSSDGSQLASGANDNVLNIWSQDILETTPRFSLTDHTAAVKALAWCPWNGHSNVLASGGGTADRHIRIWNTTTGVCLNSIDTNSQVCSLQWSRHYKELLSSHGFSKNQICVWKYPSLIKTAELTGHRARVLHTATSPDGTVVASAGADQTLRFWRVFDVTKKATTSKTSTSKMALSETNIGHDLPVSKIKNGVNCRTESAQMSNKVLFTSKMR